MEACSYIPLAIYTALTPHRGGPVGDPDRMDRDLLSDAASDDLKRTGLCHTPRTDNP